MLTEFGKYNKIALGTQCAETRGGVPVVVSNSNLISDEISEEIICVTEKLVAEDGAGKVTVRKVLRKMGVTNRVFYNRFHNIYDVLKIIYRRAVIKMHKCLDSEFDPRTDFYNYVMDVAVKVLINTYDVKNQFSRYMFEFDSQSEANMKWWTGEVKKLIEIAKETEQIKSDVDSDMLSYAIWCFFRGYNADAVNRKIPKEEAVRCFKFGLRCLFDGVRA